MGAGVVVVVVEFEFAAESESRKSELKLESRKRETKNGRMERTSIMFRVSTRKAHFLGAPANLHKLNIQCIISDFIQNRALAHGIMGRRFPDGGLLRYRK